MLRRRTGPSPTPLLPAAWGRAVAPRAEPRCGVARIPELDAHRGIAALGIVIFHVYQLSNTGSYLYFGTPGYTLLNSLDAMVPWFFVLTAFLLFEPIARSAIDGGDRISIRRFLRRRAVRLLPVYWVAILVVWFFRQPELPGDWRDLIEHLTFTQVFDEKRIFYTIGPAWSLSVEVMFYLLLAALAVGADRYCRRLRSRGARIALLLGAVGVLFTIGAAWKAWAFYGDHRSTTGAYTTWFGPTANVDVFAVGLGAAVVVAGLGQHVQVPTRTTTALRVSGLGILTLAFGTRQADSFSGVYFSDLCAVGFTLLVVAAALCGPDDPWAHRLSLRPLVWIGTISYSLYLWHEPVMLALRGWDGLVRQRPGAFVPNTVAVLVVSLVVGWISYLLIERPTGRLSGVFDRDGHLVTRSGEAGAIEWESFSSGNPM